jgi:DNA-binding PucR family transcriptional regulator
MAAGQVHRGRNGFRRSHQEALAAKRVAQAGPWSSGRSVPYADASLVSLLLEDPGAAADFVCDELGDLAVPQEGVEALRQTLAVFLTCHSPSAAAGELFVARNTVTYRLRRIEELLPRPMVGRGLELGVALRLLKVLPVTLMSEAIERRDALSRDGCAESGQP